MHQPLTPIVTEAMPSQLEVEDEPLKQLGRSSRVRKANPKHLDVALAYMDEMHKPASYEKEH